MGRFKVPSKVHNSNNNVSSVVEELKKLHEELCNVQQDAFELFREDLKVVAARLVEAELLKNNDRTIKLLNACCLSNVLRLFAPDAPYSPSQLKDIFTLLLQQLKALADEKNVYQNYVFYLVESLATVKSIVLLLDVDDTCGERERLLQQLFGLLFDLAPQPSVSRAAKLYLLEIGQTILDEADSISTEITKCIAQKCVDIRGETRAFAGDLVRLCADKLQPAFGLYFNEFLLVYSGTKNNQNGGGGGDESESSKRLEPLRQVHSQMVQIGKVAPTALANVVAQLEGELQSVNSELRLVAITSLAPLFIVPGGKEILEMYPTLWQSWLNKMNDKLSSLRLNWSKVAVNMLHEIDPSVKGQLKEAITEKLQDIDPKVREKTIAFIKIYAEDGESKVKHIGWEICEEIGNRCRDKVEDVRMIAMETLTNLIRTLNPQTNKDCFSGTVNALFKLIYTGDRDLRIFYEYYIEHSIMTPQGVDRQAISNHAILLVNMFQVMSEESLKAFKKWLNDKSLFVRYYEAYLKLSNSEGENSLRLAPLIQALSNLFRVPLDSQTMLQVLPKVILSVDKESKKLLTEICQVDTKLTRQKELFSWVSEVDWQKKDARIKGYLMTFMVRRGSLFSIHGDILSAILKVSDKDLLASSRKLVSELISEFPTLGVKHAAILEETIIKSLSTFTLDMNAALEAYARLVAACSDKVNPSEELLNVLIQNINSETPSNVKLSTRILATIRPQVLECHVKLALQTLDHNPCSVNSWNFLRELAKHSSIMVVVPEIIDTIREHLNRAINVCLELENSASTTTRTSGEKATSGELELGSIFGIKCLRNMLLAMRHVNREQEMHQLCIFAPLFVEWSSKPLLPSKVKYCISKSLLVLVPRPTATTFIYNLGGILKFAVECPEDIREKFAMVILRQYHLGNIGMIYLTLLAALIAENGPSRIIQKSLISNLRKNDRNAEVYLPLQNISIDINSRNLKRYEDWFVISIMVIALHPMWENLDEGLLTRYSAIVETLVDSIATEVNISLLFDATVQLKRYEFAPESAHHRNKNLYVLCEMCQNALRSRASSAKWALQSVKAPIVIMDELVREITSTEEMNRNVNRAYLSRVTQKLGKVQKGDKTQHYSANDKEASNENLDLVDNNNYLENPANETIPSTANKKLMVRRSSRIRTPPTTTTTATTTITHAQSFSSDS